MPSPEQSKDRERSLPSYYQAARFAGEHPAGKAYNRVQATIFQAECDLSAYRLRLNRIWHVAVVGEPPPDDLATLLRGILATGTPVDLPPELLTLLHERSIQQRRKGPWSEGHYRPGKRL